MSDDDDARIDFSSIDPTQDANRFDRIVTAIGRRAAPELSARREQYSAIIELARWRRPMLAAAALVVLVSATVLSQIGAPEATPMTDGIGEAMGVPVEFAEWLQQEDLPTTVDLISVF